MAYKFDPNMHWTDHFVKYGFAILRDQVDREFIDRAVARIRENIEGSGRDLSMNEWTVGSVKFIGKTPGDPVLDEIYNQPKIRHIIDTMFGTSEVGSPGGWSGKPLYQVFLTAFNPDYKPQPFHGGHIDFGGHMIPQFGDAFVMQVSLVDTEPNGGNITVVPGSHKLVQQRIMADPYCQYPQDFEDFPFEESVEFVAKAGDVILVHHLCFHSGHANAAANHSPRLSLHMQIQRSSHLTGVDPADPATPPWARSFTLNGPHADPDGFARYNEFGESKKRLWGEWTSDDGNAYFKIYTWADNALRARIRLGDVPEHTSREHRFDGREFTFNCDCEVPSGDGGTATLTRCHALLKVDSNDHDHLIATLTPEENGSAPITIDLRKTGIISTRLSGPY